MCRARLQERGKLRATRPGRAAFRTVGMCTLFWDNVQLDTTCTAHSAHGRSFATDSRMWGWRIRVLRARCGNTALRLAAAAAAAGAAEQLPQDSGRLVTALRLAAAAAAAGSERQQSVDHSFATGSLSSWRSRKSAMSGNTSDAARRPTCESCEKCAVCAQ